MHNLFPQPQAATGKVNRNHKTTQTCSPSPHCPLSNVGMFYVKSCSKGDQGKGEEKEAQRPLQLAFLANVVGMQAPVAIDLLSNLHSPEASEIDPSRFNFFFFNENEQPRKGQQ